MTLLMQLKIKTLGTLCNKAFGVSSRNGFKTTLLVGFFLGSIFHAKAQTVVLVPSTGSNSVTACTNVTLQDHAGNADYSNGVNGFTVLNASGTQTINITGTYSTESCCDPIRIISGSGTTGTVLATYQGSGTVNYTGAAGQTLTVQFTSDGSVVSSGFNFTVTYSGCFSGSVPTISSFSPGSAACNSNATVTINGTNFDNGTPIVKFNGITASHTYVNSTQLTATLPAGNTSGTITVQTSGGIASSPSNFALDAPTISSFSPSSATCNAQVTINGTNFNSASTVVRFNGITASHTFVSSTQLTATVPAGNTTGAITVQTCGASTGTSPSNFTLSAPTISSFSPSSGACNTQVTINGTNFNSTSTVVRFNGITASHTFVSSTQLTATVPAGNTTGAITVQTCGASTGTSPSNFTLDAPTISSFTPSSATCNTQVTINGTNFNSVSTVVRFNGITASHTFVSSTQLIATVPAGNTTGAITVQTCGASTANSPSNFTNASTPTISSLSANTGTRGTVITITGTNLLSPTAVTFGGTAANSFTSVSSTSITAEVGYGSTGSIAVTTCNGTATFAGFTYVAPAAASAVNVQGSASTNSITNNQAAFVDNALTVSSNGAVTGFIVTITDSYQSGDVLAYNSATGGALPAGITVASFNTTTRSLVFSGTAIGADWQRILRNVTLTTTSAVCSPESRKVAFIAGDVFYNPLNGHFYKASTSNTTWTVAKSNAENMSYFGKQGYLATISSQAENSFASKLLSTNSWLGCSDRWSEINAALGYTLYAASGASVVVGGVTYTGNNDNGNAEGNWFWVTGPEKGTRLRNGNATNLGASNNFGVGSAVAGVYQNWQGNEPNDWSASNFGDEDYGHMYTGAGDWNDFPSTSSIGSIIEFGDMPGDNTSSSINTVFTRNVYINGAPSGTINGGNVNVCSGSNSTTLTLTGIATGGTVSRWEYSLDNFLTAGTSVSSTSTSLTVSNITETRYYRAIVNASSCTGLATSSTPIFVATTTAGSIVSSKSAICTGGTAELTLSGNIGSVVRWERSASSTFASGVTNISNATTTLTETLSTAGTYHYRAVVQQTGCGAAVNSNGYPVTVTAGTPPVGGTISSTSSCSGTNSFTLTLTGHSGTITKWQFSTDGGFVWTDIAHTTASLSQNNITSNRKYRAIVSTANQACGNESSSSGEVTIFGTNVVRWDGTNSKNAKTAANWCGGIPSNGQDVVISASAGNHLMLEENMVLGSIDFNGSGKNVELGNWDLQLSELRGAGANNFIKTNGTGHLKMNIAANANAVFPVGNSSYNPVTITNKNSSSDMFEVRVLDEVYSQGLTGSVVNSPRIRRTWEINKANPNTGSGIDFTFNWNAGEAQNLSSSHRLYHYGTSWVKQSGIPTVSGNSMTYTGYTGTFSPFAIGGDLTPLPVTLLNFKADKTNAGALLTWITASELNNSHFEVLKSPDGQQWEKIGEVAGAGTSYQQNSYHFMDTRFTGSAYYKLRQVCFDENFSFSPVRFLNSISGAATTSVVYPNPSKGAVTLITPEAGRFELFDVLGKMVRRGEVNGTQNIENIKPGVYTLKVISANTIESLRLVVE
jgi:hypothetical protein